MGLFKKKSDGYVDLTEKLSREEAKLERFKASSMPETTSDSVVDMTNQPVEEKQESQSSGGFFNFFGGASTASETQSSPEPQVSGTEERKKKLSKIISDLTNRLEEQEKEIYHMKQRIEVLERKQRVGY